MRGLEDGSPRTNSFTHDGWERLRIALDPMGNVTTFTYDQNHNRTGILTYGELNDVEGTTNNVRLKELALAHDAMDRLTNRTAKFFDPLTQTNITDGEARLNVEYNNISQIVKVINDNNHALNLGYDTANRLGTLTDAKSNTRQYSYDSNNNLSRIDETDLSDLGGSQQFVTTFSYDALNRMAQASDILGNTTAFQY